MTDVFLYQGEANPSDVMLSDPTVLRGAGGAVTGTGATAQAVQTASAAVLERFLAIGVTSQARQTAAASAGSRFVIVASQSQAPQTSAGAASERFVAAGAGTQAPQTSAGAGEVVVLAIGATAQARQANEGTGTTVGAGGTTGIGAVSQARQTAEGSGVTEPAIPAPATSAGTVLRRRRRVETYFRIEPDLRFLEPASAGATGQAVTRQPPQTASGRGVVSDPDEWLLLDLEVAA